MRKFISGLICGLALAVIYWLLSPADSEYVRSAKEYEAQLRHTERAVDSLGNTLHQYGIE